eukprot:COSAG05_NODE_919_length_6591_cov_81.831793_3_plen_85_part_00
MHKWIHARGRRISGNLTIAGADPSSHASTKHESFRCWHRFVTPTPVSTLNVIKVLTGVGVTKRTVLTLLKVYLPTVLTPNSGLL